MAMVLTRHNVTGHECEFPEDTVAAWRARGWIPVSETQSAAADAVSDSAAEDAAAPTTSTKAAGRRASRNEE